MQAKNIFKNLLAFFLIGIIFTSSIRATANADDLVIKGDGEVILIVTNGVLGVSTQKKDTHPTPSKVVPLVPANTQSTVKIDPKPTTNNKINVVITTESPSQKTKTAGNNQEANQVINKVVDKVVAQGVHGEVILDIKSNEKNQITIEQNKIQASTTLPVQLDTKSHNMSVVTSSGPVNVAVLPSSAQQGVLSKGLINNTVNPSLTLTQDNNQLVYKIKGEKNGLLLNVFPVKSAVEISLSAKTGVILRTNQSLLFSVFGFLVR